MIEFNGKGRIASLYYTENTHMRRSLRVAQGKHKLSPRKIEKGQVAIEERGKENGEFATESPVSRGKVQVALKKPSLHLEVGRKGPGSGVAGRYFKGNHTDGGRRGE